MNTELEPSLREGDPKMKCNNARAVISMVLGTWEAWYKLYKLVNMCIFTAWPSLKNRINLRVYEARGKYLIKNML